MVGPASERVTSAEDLTQSEQHAEKQHPSQAAAGATAVSPYNTHQRQQQYQHLPQCSKHVYSRPDSVERVTVAVAEDLNQSEQHAERHHSRPAAARATAVPHYNTHQRQHQHQPQHSKHFSGPDSGKRNGSQRAAAAAQSRRGSDYRYGVTDVSARTSMPSSASPSGRPPHSNLDRFLEVTTPSVKSQTLRKSCLRDTSQKRCFNPEVTPFFNLADLWDSYDEWSAYGAGVPLVLNGEESVVQYYVPYLSALQLYTLPSQRRPDYPLGHRHPGGESDEGSEASSDNECESREGEARECEAKCRSFRARGYKGAESPPPNLGSSLGSSSRLDWSSFSIDGVEEGEVWSYFEHSQPYSRLPLVDKIADLSRDFKSHENPLRTLRSVDLLPGSWLSVAWYPIYRIPTGPTLRDLSACFLTFHSLSSSLLGEAGNGSVRSVCHSDVCDVPTISSIDSQRLALRAFGLASYKLKGAVWTSQPDRWQATSLQNSAGEHLKQLAVQHPDYNFFTSNSGTRH